MDPVATTVHFLHIASGAAWLGGSLFANLFLVPHTLRQPIDRRRDLARTLILGPERLMISAALLVVVTGVARGILFGRITTLEALGRPYGLVWLASIAVILTSSQPAPASPDRRLAISPTRAVHLITSPPPPRGIKSVRVAWSSASASSWLASLWCSG